MVVKKTIDVWKTKQWYTVVAPKFLGEVHTTLTIPATEEATLLNRVISIPLKEVTRDISHLYFSVRLRVSEINGKNAFTKFIGFSLAREYISTLVRRRRDALELHIPLKSKDGVEFQLSALMVTQGTCSDAQKKGLRNALAEELKRRSAAADFGDFIRSIMFQQLNAELHKVLVKIYPLKRVELTKAELYEEFDVAQAMQIDQKTADRDESPEKQDARVKEEAAATQEEPAKEEAEASAPAAAE
ncbi:MAG TPA: hypothetical protein VI875_03330 [Candidatus Norongarragalinales archaeon]|nr:hypothetical protein [Candidatus Norongarragalinales archaeon]